MPNNKKLYEEKHFTYHFVRCGNTDNFIECDSRRNFRDILFQWGVNIQTIPDYCYMVEGNCNYKWRVYSDTITLYIRVKKYKN